MSDDLETGSAADQETDDQAAGAGVLETPTPVARARRPQQAALDLGETGPRYVATDVKDLIGLVARRHNILMRADDPAFVLVTLFEDISQRHMGAMGEELRRTLDVLTAAAEEQKEASRVIAGRIINEGGDYIAQKIRDAGETMGPVIATAVLAELKPTLDGVVAQAKAADRARQVAVWGAAASILACLITIGFVMTGGAA